MIKNCIGLLILFSLIGCRYQERDEKTKIIDTLNFLSNTKWNIDLKDNDSLQVYNHSPLYFRKDYMYFYNSKVGSYELVKDSLIVKEICYIQTNDSLVKKEKIKLKAKIQKISKDSLIIEKLTGSGFFFVNYNTNRYFPKLTMLKFYNDTLNFLKKTDFTKISLSNSLCYGKCPSQAIEITSNGDCKFYGGLYSELKGNFLGKISNEFIDSLKHLLSAAIKNKENLSNLPPIDAPICDIQICFDSRDTLKIEGYPGEFPYRLYELYTVIMNSYKGADIKKTNKVNEFLTKSHIYDTTEVIPPSPEVIDDF